MGNKVTFDGVNRVIQVTLAPSLVDGDQVVALDIKQDVYSDGKEDWKSDVTLNKLVFPVSAVGGNPLPGSKALGSTFFLDPAWKIRPYEADHIFRVNGNLYSEDGTSPFTSTVGSYNVFLEQQVSSLVDSTVQQLQEIEYASFSGGVTLDVTSPYTGDVYPVGSPQAPVNNLADAMIIAEYRGFTTIYVVGDATIDSGANYEDMIFIGSSKTKSTLTVSAPSDVSRCEFYDAHVTGVLDGDSTLQDCFIDNLDYVTGYIEQCVLSAGTILLGFGAVAHFLDCWSGVPGTNTPTIDMGGAGQSLAMRNYNGGIKIINKTGPESISLDINSGQVLLDMATVTNGEIVVRGIGKCVDSGTGEHLPSGTYGSLIVLNEAVSKDTISDAAWQDSQADHIDDGTTGKSLRDAARDAKNAFILSS